MVTLLARFVDGAAESPPPDTAAAPGDLDLDLAGVGRRATAEAAGNFTVVDVIDPTPGEIARLARELDLDPLHLEDAANPKQRAKIDIEGHQVFLLMKSIHWREVEAELRVAQVSVITRHGIAVMVRTGGHDECARAVERLRAAPELARLGPSALLYLVADELTDAYLDVTDSMQADVEEIESDVFSPGGSGAAARIYQLNRQNLELRRSLHPLIPVAHELAMDHILDVPVELRPYFADVADHMLRAADAVDGFDTILLSMLMASTALQDLQQNRDMRKISAWVAIAAVPTMIAGIYGMNFDDMPELHWSLGYPAVLLLMLTVCLLLYRAFKRSGWL
jgi:magnesium transporter